MDLYWSLVLVQDEPFFALWWLTMVVAIMNLGEDVSGVAQPFLAVYT
jgi:hypothetical protein